MLTAKRQAEMREDAARKHLWRQAKMEEAAAKEQAAAEATDPPSPLKPPPPPTPPPKAAYQAPDPMDDPESAIRQSLEARMNMMKRTRAEEQGRQEAARRLLE